MPEYKHNGPIDCDVDINLDNVNGKTAVVTGGASGIGEAYVRALAGAGVYVFIGDRDVLKGEKLAAELPGTRFIECNVTDWESQVNLFREANAQSPTGKISYVVANAGIIRSDDVFSYDESGPSKPDLITIDVNIYGTLYTTKLAMHYFIAQNGTTPSPTQQDTCLVLIGSGAAFLDCLRIPQYSASKWAARGIMHSLRQTAYYYGSRVNVISPWYVKTGILSEEAWQQAKDAGVEFAEAADAGQCLLRILSDSTVNGHSFFVAARKWAKRGYIDLDLDDYTDDLLKEIQADQVRTTPVSAGLFA